MPWYELALAFFSAVVGVVVTLLSQNWNENRKERDEYRFEIYMKLLEFKGLQFWTVGMETIKQDLDEATLSEQHQVRMQIADLLRKADDLTEAEDIARVLFGLDYESERERDDALTELLDRLGDRINPKYNKIMRQIDRDNRKLLYQAPEKYMRRLRRQTGL